MISVVQAACPHSARKPLVQPLPAGQALYRSVAGQPTREYFLYIPQGRPAARLVVLMHGISENACEQVLRFAPEAEKAGAVLVAPLMRRAIFGQYQQLIDPRQGIRADLALEDILHSVRLDIGLDAAPFDMFGFSGGGQFAHRFALLNPRAVRSCVVAAPGWFTFPDDRARYPAGLAQVPDCLPPLDEAAVCTIPFHVIVGDQDTARDASLRRSARLDRQQGRTRLERAERWHQAMRGWGADPRSSLTILPQLRHSFAEAVRDHGLAALTFRLFG